MRISAFYLLLILISTSLIFSACGDGTEPMDQACTYDLNALQLRLGEDQIMPAWSQMVLKSQALNAAVLAFTERPQAAELAKARAAYIETYLAYQAVSPFGFGPATEQGFDYRERVNTFPASTAGIEQAIEDELFDLENSFKSVVGLPAIGYLLYGVPNTSEAEVLAAFTDPKRGVYLQLLSSQILARSQFVLDAWSPENGDYLAGFSSSTGSGEGSALSLLVNDLNYDFEILKNFKFKIPLGKLNGGIIQPQKAEGYYAGVSLALAKAQLAALKQVYVGRNGAELSLDGYLRCLRTGQDTDDGLLADDILAQWSAIDEALQGLADPLALRLEDNKAAVDAAHLDMQQMIPLLKREMTAAFGVRISYIDNDGD